MDSGVKVKKQGSGTNQDKDHKEGGPRHRAQHPLTQPRLSLQGLPTRAPKDRGRKALEKRAHHNTAPFPRGPSNPRS